MSSPGECRAYTADFRGWTAHFLQNDLVRLAAVPDIGGRVMAYDLGPYPFLFVDPHLAGRLFSASENQGDGTLAAWKNYGGDKTWPAPQGWETDAQWHGPPDPVLDTGRYTLEALQATGDTATLHMASPPDARTGVQITRQFTIGCGSSRVAVDLAFTNISERPIRWSIWDVIQLRAERLSEDGHWQHDPSCTVTAPLNPQSRFSSGYNVMFGALDNPQWRTDEERQLFIGRYLWEIGKVGLDSPGGWIAFSQGSEGYAFTERFDVQAGAEYPDDGATVECWTVGAGQVANLNYEESGIYLMETEVLSPLHTIAPGETVSFPLSWGACRCPGPVVDVQEAGCSAATLRAKVVDGFVRLSGQFGVFDRGALALVWWDAYGAQVGRQNLGAVDPLAMVHLDRVLPRPAGATQVELRVTPAGDQDGHELLLASAVVT